VTASNPTSVSASEAVSASEPESTAAALATAANDSTSAANTNPAPAFDSATFRNVLGHFPTGVTVITAMGPDGPAGLAVGSFASVSLEPPLVMFCPGNQSSSWPSIKAAGVFCANVLADDQKDVCSTFASKAPDKFANVSWTTQCTGSPVLDGAEAWIDCEIIQAIEAGDHWVVLGKVLALDAAAGKTPLLFYRGGYGCYKELGAE